MASLSFARLSSWLRSERPVWAVVCRLCPVTCHYGSWFFKSVSALLLAQGVELSVWPWEARALSGFSLYACVAPLTVAVSPRHLQEPHQTLEAMLRPKVTTLPGHIQAVYVQNVVKLYASILLQKEQAGETEAAQEVTQVMVERLPQFVQSADLEVQERVRLELGEGPAPGRALHSLEGVCPWQWSGCRESYPFSKLPGETPVVAFPVGAQGGQ